MIRIRIVVPLIALALAACSSSPPEPGPEQTVEVLREVELTARGRTPENDPALTDVEVYADRLVFRYSGAPTVDLGPIDLGDLGTFNPVVAGVQGGGYLREILSIREVSPGVFEAMTGPAYLTDYIARGHFRVHHDPRPTSWGAGENVASAALEGSVTLLPVELNDACEFSSGGSLDVTPILDLDVDFDIDIDIDVDATWRPPFIEGRLESADFVMNGQLQLGATVEASTNGTVSCELDLIEFARERGIRVPKAEWTTTFAVGVVPVVLTHTIGPTASVSISGSVETGNATASGSVTYTLSAGTRYRRTEGGWREVWDPRRSSTGSFEVGMPGTVTIEAGISAGVEYECKLYDVLGPKIGLEGSLTGTFESDLCEWSGEVSAGLSIVGGGSIDIPVIDQTLVEFEVSQEIASATLWERMGTWPWCRDGGEPDAGMGDAPEEDPCSSASDCASCNAMAGCGFCAASNTCMNDIRMPECSGGWREAEFECVDCRTMFTDCGTCMLQGECGWCASNNTCMTADTSGLPPEPCPDWHYTDVDFCSM